MPVHNHRLHHRQCRLEAFLCRIHRQQRQQQQGLEVALLNRSQDASVALALQGVNWKLTESHRVLGVQTTQI